jgi:serine/threonine protein kinase
MAAKLIQIGEPAHDAERQALRFLVEGLPESFTVYGNAWLVERSGVVYELDAVVVAPHAIFVVEIKSYRGRIEGTDNDWWLPEKIRSPLKLNRITSQVLKSHLKSASYQAGQVWTEGLIFLSATTNVGVRGPASNDRVHTRKTILAALQDPGFISRLSGGRALTPSSSAERELLELCTGVQGGPRPVRRVREYEVVETLDHHDTFTELLGKNALSGAERVLRIYSTPPLATQAQRDRIAERARWEAQVLGRLGRSEGVLTAEQPFSDESGIVLPLEHFKGITLTTWVERYGLDARGKEKADLRIRTDLWMRIARTIDEVHRQGVVHRLLRPDVVLVEDKQDPTEVRITGFDLAKQMTSDATISLTTIHDDRLVYAAPEVVTAFSSAEPASDQFSLGAMLALVLTGKPLFENTRPAHGGAPAHAPRSRHLAAPPAQPRRSRGEDGRAARHRPLSLARRGHRGRARGSRSVAPRAGRHPERGACSARCRQPAARDTHRHRLRDRHPPRARRHGRRVRRAPPRQRAHARAQDRALRGRRRGSAVRRRHDTRLPASWTAESRDASRTQGSRQCSGRARRNDGRT